MEEIGGEDKGDMLATEGVGERLQPACRKGHPELVPRQEGQRGWGDSSAWTRNFYSVDT